MGFRPGEVVLCGLLLALGFGAAGYFVSNTLVNSEVGVNVAEVRGLAERRVQADVAYWEIRYALADRQRSNLARLYERSAEAEERIVNLLVAEGLERKAIQTGALDYDYQEYRNEGQELIDEKHILRGVVAVETEQVALVPKLRSALNRLVAEGLPLTNLPPRYRFTGLNDIKPDMLREATTNAREAANEFASNAGVRVGGIRSARQGSFVIRDVGSDYDDSGRIDKTVRVVTTTSFYLTEG